jgi:hypothetical protein
MDANFHPVMQQPNIIFSKKKFFLKKKKEKRKKEKKAWSLVFTRVKLSICHVRFTSI